MVRNEKNCSSYENAKFEKVSGKKLTCLIINLAEMEARAVGLKIISLQ